MVEKKILILALAICCVLLFSIKVNAERSYKAGDIFKDCEHCPSMVVVPAGSFMMGSTSSETGRKYNELPYHKVRIRKPFAVGRFELTFSEYDMCVQLKGCPYAIPDEGWGRGQKPAINLSWNYAKSYVKWLSGVTGKPYRLLSESEWEYVARAGSDTAFWWGNSISSWQANYNGNFVYNGGEKGISRGRPVKVNEFQPNPWGLYNMHGNVHEWVEDCYHKNYYNAPRDGKPRIKKHCFRRVVRGGYWHAHPENIRSASRDWGNAGYKVETIGVRVARDLE